MMCIKYASIDSITDAKKSGFDSYDQFNANSKSANFYVLSLSMGIVYDMKWYTNGL